MRSTSCALPPRSLNLINNFNAVFQSNVEVRQQEFNVRLRLGHPSR